jgi:hypothetical protein
MPLSVADVFDKKNDSVSLTCRQKRRLVHIDIGAAIASSTLKTTGWVV